VPAHFATLANPPTPVSGSITGSETASERRIRRSEASAEPVSPKIARLRAMLRRVAAGQNRCMARTDGLVKTRDRDPSRVAARKIGKGTVDAMIRDGGRFQGLDGNIYTIPLEEAMPMLGSPIATDPGQGILEEIARSRGHIAFLERKLIEMDEAELVMTTDTIEEERSGGPGGGYSLKRKENRQAISPWWALYERERRHFASVCAAAVRAGVEERRIRIAERQQDVLEAAFVAAIADLGLDPHDSRVRKVLGARLQQAIESGTSPSQPQVAVPAERVIEAEPVINSRPRPVDF
jgi:hypothetical protein